MTEQYLIIGGSSGIGLSIVRQLLDKGHRVEVWSRSMGDLAEHENLQHRKADILDERAELPSVPSGLSGLAYCPGSINLKPFRSLRTDDFREDLEINLLGAVRAIRAALSSLRSNHNSSVVLFSTVAVGQGMPFHSSVSAAKGAVEGLTRAMAAEFAPRVRFNCIAPSLTDTPMAARLLSTDSKREASAARHPMGRVGRPDEIADLACYLLSGRSSWVSGQVLSIDGGISALRV